MITCSKIGSASLGRLGNQMFQYALLYAVSKRNNYEIGGKWRLGEKYFGIKNKPMRSRPVYTYRQEFGGDVFAQPDGTDYYGFFQVEKYFLNIRDDIIGLYQPRQQVKEKIERFKHRYLNNGKSTIVCGVRGRDYIVRNLPVPDEDYYREALGIICKRDNKSLEDYNIVVVTDDSTLARKIFKFLPKSIFARERGIKNIAELFLMAQANRCVLAASSFQWWGGWLNDKDDKIVVAPLYWVYCNRGDAQWLAGEGLKAEGWIFIKPRKFVTRPFYSKGRIYLAKFARKAISYFSKK